MSAASPATSKQRHAATQTRIVDAARDLVSSGRELTLRAVAREIGVTAPALYRYAASYEDLVKLTALAIDAEVAADIVTAANRFGPEDPAARIIAASVAFRHWALTNREEFALVFTNVDVDCLNEIPEGASTGMAFSTMLFALWEKYQFPVPALAELDPGLAEILHDPQVPADLSGIPDELRGLIWVLQRAWSRLYGTVTLEVFGHIDPRMVEQTHLFRAMISDQAGPLGLNEELPRLQALLSDLLG